MLVNSILVTKGMEAIKTTVLQKFKVWNKRSCLSRMETEEIKNSKQGCDCIHIDRRSSKEDVFLFFLNVLMFHCTGSYQIFHLIFFSLSFLSAFMQKLFKKHPILPGVCKHAPP